MGGEGEQLPTPAPTIPLCKLTARTQNYTRFACVLKIIHMCSNVAFRQTGARSQLQCEACLRMTVDSPCENGRHTCGRDIWKAKQTSDQNQANV